MAKTKRQRQNIINKVVKKAANESVRNNPFEVRINKKKFDVLGQKRERSERGLPGISRSRALEKRKNTLLKAYKERDKTNQILDKRFGRHDLPEEERELERFLLETKRRHKKSHAIFNLGDNEEGLTHFGQSLGDHYNDIILTSDNEQEDVDMTENHFGGFLKRKESSLQESLMEGPHKTRKEMMKEIVQKSKLHKYERQKERETIESLLDKVNDNWKDIQTLLSSTSSNTAIATPTQDDDYDRYLVELSNEPKGQAKDRLKTAQEQDEEEQLHLERYERERKLRMLPTPSTTAITATNTISSSNSTGVLQQYISADDDTTMRMSKTDQRVMIHYDDEGKLILPGGETSLINNDNKQLENISSSEEEESENEGDEQEVSEEEDEQEIDTENEQEIDTDEEGSECSKQVWSEDRNDDEKKSNEHLIIGHKSEGLPSNITELSLLLQNKSPDDCLMSVMSIIKQLTGNDKTIIKTFMSLLIEYCLYHTFVNPLQLNELIKGLYELARLRPDCTLKCFQKKLKSFYKKSITDGNYPQMSDLIFFKLISSLFPCSDYRHPIATPTLFLMSSLLQKSVLCTSIDRVCIGLVLCHIMLEYICVSKRYIPELINYLDNVLKCFVSQNGEVTFPFTDEIKVDLSLHTYTIKKDIEMLNYFQLMTTDIKDLPSNQIKLSLLKLSLNTLHSLIQYWYQLSSFDVIFKPFLISLNNLQVPKEMKTLLESIKETLEAGMNRPKPILQVLRCKPKSVVFFEPQFDISYQPGKRKAPNKGLVEQAKLRHKHKKELKGAIREIRKDNKFLARQKLKEQLIKDTERKKKVKQIEGWLGEQQHDMKMERLRKSRKRK